ncbi:MAG: 4Fe-4S binding protein [Candidatus Dactylopiibacterium sp.]|nr:4Fe-4S binding protein [Candidatus Dactylopiibacterium sp.]
MSGAPVTAPPCALRPFARETQLAAWPATPQADAGQLVASNGGWRSLWPAIALDACNGCGLCLLFCPDGAMVWNAHGLPEVAADWCKGCGLCARECPKDLIVMQAEPTP